MTLSQQVVSLELAKRLKELGVKQKSLFFWWVDSEEKAHLSYGIYGGNIVNHVCALNFEYSAFTVAELLPKLEDHIDHEDIRSRLKIDMHHTYPGIEYTCGYHADTSHGLHFGYIEDSLVNACAKTLIHLLEKKLITL